MQAPREDFVRRIQDYRRRGASARQTAERALEAAGSDMAERVSRLEAFAAMGSPQFPFETYTFETSADLPEPPDHGANVTSIQRDGRVAKLTMQARSGSADETAVMSLSIRSGAALWTVEWTRRGFDGSDAEATSEHGHADDALASFTSRVFSTAVDALCGQQPGKPVRFRGHVSFDLWTARDGVQHALNVRSHLEGTRAMRRQQAGRTGAAIRSAWDAAASRIGFLAELGYGFGEGEGDRVEASSTGSGMVLTVVSGENRTMISAEASKARPGEAVTISVSDWHGRSEERGEYALSELDAISSELADAVLDEIEEAEASWVPAASADREFSPGM